VVLMVSARTRRARCCRASYLVRIQPQKVRRHSGGLGREASVIAGIAKATSSRAVKMEGVAETSVRTSRTFAARMCRGTISHAKAEVEVAVGTRATLREASAARLDPPVSGIP